MFSANSSQVSEGRLYVEDVFSTYLYTGNGSTQTITNGIDLAGKGGLVWLKVRNSNGTHLLYDTLRGNTNSLSTDTAAQQYNFYGTTTFSSTGFTNNTYGSSDTVASWTFREAPKFFDVVTYTGNGTVVRQINHSLGVTPGFIVVKRTDSTGNWMCVHRNNPMGELVLNSSAANTGNTDNIEVWTSTYIGVSNAANTNGATYVAYLFAHDTTSDGIIQCGSFTTDGSANATVNLGWEPQWALVKRTDSVDQWYLNDSMRGIPVSGSGGVLYANQTYAEDASSNVVKAAATGFTGSYLTANATYVYIAIRRGPMRTPTSGTSVFEPVAATQGLNTSTPATSSITDDLFISSGRASGTVQFNVGDRLRGSPFMYTQGTVAETSGIYKWDRQTGVAFSANLTSSGDLIMYHFRRAPSFFDEVCYTGTGVARTINHNLGVAPELMIVKRRSASGSSWCVYASSQGNTKVAFLDATNAFFDEGGVIWNSTSPTSTLFSVAAAAAVNASGNDYVAYLFASCPGVSKVGSYTGNGSSQTINCGFAAGARFVMIKRTDSTGDWYVWDSARGIVAGNDPRLSLNSTAAEVTTDDSVDTASSGFVVNQLSATNINVSSATYIYLAVA